MTLFCSFPAWTLIHWIPVPKGPWLWAVIALFSIQIALVVFGRDAAFLKEGKFPRIIYRFSMLSFVLNINLFMASFLHALIRMIITIFGWNVSAAVTLLPLFSAALIVVAAGMVNALKLHIRRVSFDISTLPVSWQGRRIVFFSDTHYGTLNGPGMAERLVDEIQALNPDLIICGGDLFDGPRGEYSATLEVLARLNAPLGILAVLGNHDYYYLSHPGSSRELMKKQRNHDEMPMGEEMALATVKKALSWKFLENESIEIDGVIFAGLRPFSLTDEKQALIFLSGMTADKPTILINHKPRQVEAAARAGFVLQLSGHTHGGPVFPVNILMKRLMKGRHFGTSIHGDMILETSSGSGISLWFPRTAGHHELVVIEFISGVKNPV